ncbi:DUF1569 domain-containing protein [Elizabethkingia meningoseptica]|nr:DUF1569 domain-containing protein [Elizabethkingia meningoseptica]
MTESSKPQWGKMSPQEMLEHLEATVSYGMGDPERNECYTPEENIEKYQDSLYNHRKMPKEFPAPFLPKDGSLPELKHKNLDAAKEAFLERVKQFIIYYKENPLAEHNHFVFGRINKEMWELMHRKHFTHHFEQFGLI